MNSETITDHGVGRRAAPRQVARVGVVPAAGRRRAGRSSRPLSPSDVTGVGTHDERRSGCLALRPCRRSTPGPLPARVYWRRRLGGARRRRCCWSSASARRARRGRAMPPSRGRPATPQAAAETTPTVGATEAERAPTATGHASSRASKPTTPTAAGRWPSPSGPCPDERRRGHPVGARAASAGGDVTILLDLQTGVRGLHLAGVAADGHRQDQLRRGRHLVQPGVPRRDPDQDVVVRRDGPPRASPGAPALRQDCTRPTGVGAAGLLRHRRRGPRR